MTVEIKVALTDDQAETLAQFVKPVALVRVPRLRR